MQFGAVADIVEVSSMLTGDLVRVKISKQRVIPLYIDRDAAHWLEAAESLLLALPRGDRA